MKASVGTGKLITEAQRGHSAPTSNSKQNNCRMEIYVEKEVINVYAAENHSSVIRLMWR